MTSGYREDDSRDGSPSLRNLWSLVIACFAPGSRSDVLEKHDIDACLEYAAHQAAHREVPLNK